MPCAATLKPENRFKALFVGSKHSGKTVAACSFKKDPAKRLKVLDFDGRITGLLGAPWIDRSRIDYEYYPPRVGNNQKPMYTRINDDMEAMLVQTNMSQSPYEGVIADSLTAETFGLLCDSVPMTHANNKGKKIGVMNMAGPEDYGFEAQGTYNLMAFLRSLPIPFVIVTAHVVDKFGKLKPDDPFSESVVVGEKLSIRDKIGTNIGIYFDHIFRFDRKVLYGKEKFTVQFRSAIACTSFSQLPEGEIDITGKSFQDVLNGFLGKEIQV